MNNKGQSLVAFVLMVPIIFILVSFMFKIGNLSYLKNSYENEIKSVIKYGLNHLDDDNLENKLRVLLDSNIDGEKNIKIDNNVIIVNFKKKDLKIDLTFTGKKENDKITIESS